MLNDVTVFNIREYLPVKEVKSGTANAHTLIQFLKILS